MQYKGIVFFDYDGTLTEESKGIFLPTKKSVDAINEVSKNGYLAVLATGRSMCYIPDAGINFGGYITANGAHAWVNKKEIFRHFVDKDKLRKFIDKVDEMGLYYAVENQERGYAKDKDAKIFYDMLDNFKIPRSVFGNIDKENLPDTSKILVAYNKDGDHEELCKHLGDIFTITPHRKYPSADIQEKGINKGVGARAICEYLNMPKDKCYAFGDGANDIELFEAVGHPIAMGYHSPVLDSVCEYVTKTVEDEGIAYGLSHFGLI